MSTEWDEMNDENPAETDNSEKGIANLRKAYERKAKAEKELRDQLAQLQSRERERTLSETLSAKDANPKLAKFYPADRDGTPEKVEEWLAENAELFGHSPAPQAPTPAQVSPELRSAYEQFQTPGNSQPNADVISQIRNFDMTTQEGYDKFQAWMRQHPEAVYN